MTADGDRTTKDSVIAKDTGGMGLELALVKQPNGWWIELFAEGHSQGHLTGIQTESDGLTLRTAGHEHTINRDGNAGAVEAWLSKYDAEVAEQFSAWAAQNTAS